MKICGGKVSLLPILALFFLLSGFAYAQTGPKLDITLSIYSGRFNPEWSVTDAGEIGRLKELMESLPRVAALKPNSFHIFILESNGAIPGFPQTVYVHNGIIKIRKTDGTIELFQDAKGLKGYLTNKAIERNIGIPPLLAGDLDNDLDIDQDDIDILLKDENKPTDLSACGLRCDFDRDGKITALDARKMTLLRDAVNQQHSR